MTDAFSRRSGLPGPDDLSLSLDNVMVGLKVDSEGCAGPKALGKIHTASPFAQVASPAYDDSGRREAIGLEQEGKRNHVPGGLSPLRPFKHGVTS
jgi:hypothetical protein